MRRKNKSVNTAVKIKRSSAGLLANISIYTVLAIYALIVALPFYNMLIMSFSSYADVARSSINFFPKNPTLVNYIRIYNEKSIPNAMLVSAFNVVAGTTMSLILTVLASYVLSRKNVPFRKLLFYICIFTMYFGAGLLPWYLVLRDLGFVDSIWVMTVPGMLSTFNMILVRNFFFTIPDSLEESAKLDGAGDLRILWKIFMPLSLPILATVGLFYAVGFWNEWWTAMLFIRNQKIIPLNLLLRRIVLEALINLASAEAQSIRASTVRYHSRSIGMAATTVATIPILCVYPFLQKYFTKGLILGAIKA